MIAGVEEILDDPVLELAVEAALKRGYGLRLLDDAIEFLDRNGVVALRCEQGGPENRERFLAGKRMLEHVWRGSMA